MSRSRKVVGLVVLLVAVAVAGYLAVHAHVERGVVEFSTQAKVVAHELTTTTDSVSTSRGRSALSRGGRRSSRDACRS